MRDCSNFKGLDENYIRVAVRKESDNEMLLECMACLLATGSSPRDRRD
ncbi:MAG: threonine-phosphate decarboxylase [Syntrophorhabdus sp. PtaB.Bin047]|nr:MAG: threonine-phosphate decarboxylase [Syntrophorhabdus sp. PtaB.Bin047]